MEGCREARRKGREWEGGESTDQHNRWHHHGCSASALSVHWHHISFPSLSPKDLCYTTVYAVKKIPISSCICIHATQIKIAIHFFTHNLLTCPIFPLLKHLIQLTDICRAHYPSLSLLLSLFLALAVVFTIAFLFGQRRECPSTEQRTVTTSIWHFTRGIIPSLSFMWIK